MIAAASLSVALVSCENFYHYGPFALGTDGDQVLITSCENLLLESAYLEERPDAPGNRGRRHVWEVGGRSGMRAGDVLVVGGDNAGLKNELRKSFTVIPGARYFFESKSEEGDESALFVIPAAGIEDGDWVSPDGEVRSAPCSAD
ncbi:hypothetical protein ACTJKH_17505 [Microbacterium sp. 22215]|uniref:hypothetical protein n=1 Tax=Microbacterium sp. 22215 TaxID=3453893 RepID=UPI003F8750E1